MQKGTCLDEDTLVTLSSGLSKKIKDINIGDEIWGYNGKGLSISKCTNKAFMGRKETLKITFKNGEFLICTPDHRILTKDGWVEAQNLNNDSKVVSNLYAPYDINDDDEKYWTLKITDKKYGNISFDMTTDKNRNKKHLLF